MSATAVAGRPTDSGAPGRTAVHRRPVAGDVRWRPEAPGPGHTAGRPCTPASTLMGRRRRQAARIRRRRIVLAALTLGMLVALALPWGGAGGHTLATRGSVLAGATLSAGTTYVVQPGDTMWTIAERLDPSGDPRVIVSQLEQQVGSETLQPGQRIVLP